MQPSVKKSNSLDEIDIGIFNQVEVKSASKPVNSCFNHPYGDWVGFGIGSCVGSTIGVGGGIAVLFAEQALCSTLAPAAQIALGIGGGIPGILISYATAVWFNLPKGEKSGN